MVNNYYYLVAGLPEIAVEGSKNLLAMNEFMDLLAEQVEPADAALLSVLRLPADNRNLLTVLEKRNREFDPQGNYSREELEEEIRVPDRLPSYMHQYIEAHREGRQVFQDYAPDDQLSWLFYDEVTAHPNGFLREWFRFDLGLRNVLAGLNCRRLSGVGGASLALDRSIICRDDAAELILKSNAPDFGLGSVFPWIDRVMSFDPADLTGFEKSVDTLRWDVLGELTVFTYFQIETILAFCVKLGIVDRWTRLEPAAGKERLERLLAELESGFALSEETK